MASYADLVMLAIPVGFIGITVSFVLLGASTVVAVPAGSMTVIAIMVHALFVNPPRSAPATPARTPEPEADARSEAHERTRPELA
ncbi:hypothetical protein [Halalkalicoccus subterraneus]|uniref:hypothetical protein n=1 Tax=Halalkalicoccus subterraneus TaxID=2675002 RepID=UPI000EFABDA6|nr:hypothetical protein [Halalkalicoccus subterraneus]